MVWGAGLTHFTVSSGVGWKGMGLGKWYSVGDLTVCWRGAGTGHQAKGTAGAEGPRERRGPGLLGTAEKGPCVLPVLSEAP